MGARGDARTALVTWLTDAEITGLDKVWPTSPREPRGFNFLGYGADPHHCQAVVYIAEEGELRFAIGGAHSGKKRIDYLVSVELFHHSIEVDPIVTMDDFDRIVDAIKDRLRADRLLGQTDNIVWQAGEGGYGIQCDFAPPRVVASEPTETWGRLRFEITQWINS